MQVELEQKLKKPLTKTEQKLLSELVVREHPEIVTNPFSGAKVMLQPKAVALYDFIMGSQHLIAAGNYKNIKLFDTARYLFQKLWPNSYMELLD